MDTIVNKVASSGLITLDLGEFYPVEEKSVLDIAPQLFKGLILKEKDFRSYIADTDWSVYQSQVVCICCSVDAIVPEWAYMLLSSVLTPFASYVGFGSVSDVEHQLFRLKIGRLNAEDFIDQRVVIKGCGEKPVPTSAYVEVVRVLQPVVKSIMFGEPCSTVPVYKKRRADK